MAEEYSWPSCLSPEEFRKQARDVRLLHRIVQRRGFYFVLDIMLARDRERGLRWVVHQLGNLVTVDALRKTVDECTKRDACRPRESIPGEALKARALMRATPGMSRSEAVRQAVGINSRHQDYQRIYDAAKNRERDIDQILDLEGVEPGTLPEDIAEDAKEFWKAWNKSPTYSSL